ncbi:hypothetical protein [Anaeromyxobacter oryzae]|uniref:Lipid/polyisoprenoid-binding YceI-like domain-containing protein n=1 Tax=Anaeromyxobacter oryzae TaxID=2918170 RepID=A0ABM7WPF2_9BACT|nr:hypothetical protein [Anaeromyxobacter oryzae]BDG01343.1 hypothetical protein AMOR_03390 [Anaeromyxobacter oryzae]
MKTLLKMVLAVVLLSGVASAQSAKVEMKMGEVKALQRATTLLAPTDYVGGWTTVMSGAIHTSSQKDLMFGVSIVTSLMTDTTVSSSRYTKDTSSAEAKIEVQVLVDGKVAAPGPVTFDRRKQTLMAQFDGFACDIAADGTLSGCRYQDEVLQLILDTEAAHAFFFGAANVGVGDHTIEVQARTAVDGSSQAGAWAASAFLGKGAFTVEEVRLVKDAVPTL